MKTGLVISFGSGLGDNFVTCGMTNFMSQFYDKVIVLAQMIYFKTLHTLYQDNPKIAISTFYWDHELTSNTIEFLKTQLDLDDIKILSLYDEYYPHVIKGYEKRIYKNANLPYSVRYDFFNAPNYISEGRNILKKMVKSKPYCLISSCTNSGRFDLKIDTPYEKIYIEPGITDNMMHFLELIYKAEEIHCVDSSFYHLVESINLEKQKFFHAARHAKQNNPDMILEPSESWKIIEY